MRKQAWAAMVGLLAGAGLALEPAPGSPRVPQPQAAASANEGAPTLPPPDLPPPPPRSDTEPELLPPRRQPATPGPVFSSSGVTFGQGLDTVTPWVLPPPEDEVHPPWPNGVPNLPHPKPPPPPIPWGGHNWATLEGLVWWQKKTPLPQGLITSGSILDPVPGALGQRNTKLDFGFGDMGHGPFLGGRAFVGAYLDPHQVLGLEAGGFALEQRSSLFWLDSITNKNALLAFRHLDPSGAEDAFVEAAGSVRGQKLGPFSGGVAVQTDDRFWGTEANVLHALAWQPAFRLELIAGLRYLDLSEGLVFMSRKSPFNGGTATFLGAKYGSPAFTLTDDDFHTRDEFLGGQLGLRGDWVHGRYYVGLTGKVALGRTDEELSVLGVSTLQAKNTRAVMVPGGLYALPSNSGRVLNQEFSVVPEFQVRGGVQLTPWLRVFGGYNFLYWTRVLRPGDNVDLTIDPRQVPTDPAYKAGTTATFPRPMSNPTDFWTHGVTFSLELLY